MENLDRDYVMIIDDESSIVEMLVEVMGLAGFKSEGFTKPQAALNAFRGNPLKYKVVVTDLTMPEMKGDELAHQIKQSNPDCLVVLSTGAQPELLSPKFNDVTILHKPYHIENLIDLIRTRI